MPAIGNITGGNFGNFFVARAGSEVNISGGNFGLFQPDNPFPAATPTIINAASGSTLNISGGTFEGNVLNANSNSEVNLVGTEFFVNGVKLDPWQLNEPFIIADRDVTLSGTFLDGSPFDFFLSTNDVNPTEATVTVSTISVPEPSGLALLLAGGVVSLLVRRRN